MFRHFIGVWFLYWSLVWLLPVESIFPATIEAFLLQAIFVLLVVIGYKLALSVWRTPRMPDAQQFEIPNASRLIHVGLLMSVIGFASLMYDKVYVQRIDFSDGLVVAREAWRQIGEEREGAVSSIFSMVGYLFGSAYYASVVIAITQARFISSNERILTLLAGIALMLANSIITGGRSNVLLLATFVLAAFTARNGLNLRDVFTSAFQLRCIKLLILLAATYTLLIFYQRSQASDQLTVEYVLGFLPFLGLNAREWYVELLDDDIFSSLSALLVLAVAYLTHSFATTAAIIDGSPEDKTIIFLHISAILYKLGLGFPPDGEWFLSGRMPSMPGALWHQFGVFGFLACSLLLGAISAGTKIWTALRPHHLLPLGAYVAAESTLLLTPVLFAPDFLSFPFVVAAFFMLAILGYFSRPKAGFVKLASSV